MTHDVHEPTPPSEAAPSPLNPYDEVPYGGHPVPLSSPERLAIEAMRRGLSPAPPDACRVLELGCAEGGNVIPLAFHHEGCSVVGVDASEVQIATATERRDRLGLDNLELRHADILELDDSLGEFDYIICHGVFSWVPEEVRTKILAVAGKHLAPHGVLFLSYNAAPGWAFRSLMRRALMERVRGVTDAAERVGRVRQALSWMADSPLKETEWGKLLAAEAAGVWRHRGEYLVHEYLSEENRPFHFREVIDRADAGGLSFLAELSRAASDPRLEDGLKQGFSSVVDDWVEAEELSELFVFRAFRSSLFVRKDAPLSGAPSPALPHRVRFAGRVTPVNRRVSLEPEVHEFFETARGVRISASEPVLKAALLEVGRLWPRGSSFAELVERIEALLQVRRVTEPGEAIEAPMVSALQNDLLELGRLGYIDLRLLEPAVSREPPECPRVGALTRQTAPRGYGATAHHRVVRLDAFTQHLCRYLDGARPRAELAERMTSHAEAGDVKLSLEDGSPIEGDELAQTVPALIDAALKVLADEGLLEA